MNKLILEPLESRVLLSSVTVTYTEPDGDKVTTTFRITGSDCVKTKKIEEGATIVLLLNITYSDAKNEVHTTFAKVKQHYFTNQSSKKWYDKKENLSKFIRTSFINAIVLSPLIATVTAIISTLIYLKYKPLKKKGWNFLISFILSYILITLLLTFFFDHKLVDLFVLKILQVVPNGF